MTVAAFLFALMNGAIRLLGDGWGADGGEGMHPFQIAFLRNLFALAFMLPWLLRHRRGGLATGRLGPHPWRAGIGLARKSVVSGKSVSVRLDLGGSRELKKKNKI